MPLPCVQELWLRHEAPRVRTFMRDASWRTSDEGGYCGAYSTMFVCAQCQEVWALSRLLGGIYDFGWRVYSAPCPEHSFDPKWPHPPGSIIPDIGYPGWGFIDFPLLEALPVDLLRKEFEIHMAYIEGVKHANE